MNLLYAVALLCAHVRSFLPILCCILSVSNLLWCSDLHSFIFKKSGLILTLGGKLPWLMVSVSTSE
jgi:hypothetical protein